MKHWLERFSAGFFALADATWRRADRRRYHARPAQSVRHHHGRSAARRGVAARRCASRRRHLGVGHAGRCRIGSGAFAGKDSLPEEVRIPCLAALQQPQPRVALGLALRGIANSAIDVSDGLLADLGHILERSGMAAEVRFDTLPAASFFASSGQAMDELAQHCVLAGGDDYELCFTAPARTTR